MKKILIINSRGKLHKWIQGGVRPSLPYQGIARRALIVGILPEGTLSFYDKDIDVSALIK